MRTPTELTASFRASGLKVTPQRQLLFRLLHDNRAHPSADALFAVASELMPGISLRTVYQTLNDLAAMGELQTVWLGGGSARFDPNVVDHHHAVCRSCHAVTDVYVADTGAIDVDGLDGFQPDGASIIFSGTCASCRTSSPPPTPQEQQ